MKEEEIEKQSEEYLKQEGTNGEKAFDEILKRYPIKVKDEEEKENLVKLLCNFSKEVWKDGAKWGMEHAIEWHDLRKNPSDLPPKIKGACVSKYVLSENGNLVYYDYKYKMFASYMIIPIKVIAWCELPQFKE